MSDKSSSKMMIENVDRKLNLMVGTFAVVVLILFFTSLDKGRVTCRNFVANIYLYVVLAILLIGIFTLLREKYITPEEERGKLYTMADMPSRYFYGIIPAFMVVVILFIYIFVGGYQQMNHYLNHAVWLAVLLGISLGFYPMFKLKAAYNYITEAAIYVLVIFMVMSGVVYANYNWVMSMSNNSNRIYNTIGLALMITLITIIISVLLLGIFMQFGLVTLTQFTGVYRWILYLGIFLFSAYISYDTIYILKRTKSCNERNAYRYPNYPMESFMIFIDLWNIFINLLNLESFQQ